MEIDSARFEGQVVIITGAASGIGAASARLVHRRGGKVYALDVSRAGLELLKDELGLDASHIGEIDLSNEVQLRSTIGGIIQSTGRVDALINSAGIVGPTNVPLENVTTSALQRVLDVNLFGAVWLTQSVLPIMKSQKYGRIVHVASIAGKEGNPGMTPYVISKSGLIGFSKAIGKEVAPHGITVNAIAPAVIRTPMNSDTSEETLKYMISRIPMGRVGEAEEVAETVTFAASRACSFTTGFTFDASGGRATY